ncbi:MAG: DNA (cytosine-5-)-methyltransferase [Chloroflexi bacterium]|nr:DNA (cytosine-5-)-methyltransferase [Chloroflexota bacterium]
MINIPNNLKNLYHLKYIDLFAGIGGFRLALDSFGAKCVFSSEWNKFSKQVYATNFEDMPHGDITKIDETTIPDHDLLCGGFPCQAFSISGKQKGFEDTRGTLFFDIARIIKHHRPKVLILENVKNILTHNNGKTLSTIKRVLEELNYDVIIELLKGSDFGVPQHRERVFFICINKRFNQGQFKLSKPNFNYYNVNDILEKDIDYASVKINRADILMNNKEVIKDMFGNYHNKPIRIGTISKGGQGERIYSPFGTGITLSAFGGGPAKKTGGYLVDGIVRRLTVRECARMMGFPDSFIVCDNVNQAYIQFGNAVIVNIVQFIVMDLTYKNFL